MTAYLRLALLTACLGLLAPATLQLRPFIERELAALKLASYQDGFRDGLLAGAARRQPDGRIALRK